MTGTNQSASGGNSAVSILKGMLHCPIIGADISRLIIPMTLDSYIRL